MKPINLHSFISAKNHLSDTIFSNYLSLFGLKLTKKGAHDGIKPHELQTIEAFVKVVQNTDKTTYYQLLNDFYIGYTIPQISKEFDLLRFGQECVIDIEIKLTSTTDKLEKQLTKNRYYLSFLSKELHLYSFVADTGKLYKLTDDCKIEEVNPRELCECLSKQESTPPKTIDTLFNPSNYLVSPFNSTDKFINGEYFLTGEQSDIKKEILNAINKKQKFFAITGSAGTGKTLLTYDIAKEAISKNCQVMIIHCGPLNSGQYKLKEDYQWHIFLPKYAINKDFSKYDLIIIDEAQRIYQDQREDIIEKVLELNLKCIFSYDQKQWLRQTETVYKNDIRIDELCIDNTHRLQSKIRTNKVVASFIRKLLDKGGSDNISSYNNIEVCYCKALDEVVNLSELLTEQGWQIINYTPSQSEPFHYQSYSSNESTCSHSVIGQEFDNVAVVIDDNFKYDGNRLVTIGKYKGYYSQRQMLFQNLTRTRKRLFIIVYNNEEVLERCAEILSATV